MRVRYLPLFSLVVALFITWQQACCFAELCPACGGSGFISCPDCGGTGVGTTYVVVNGLRAYDGCPRCGGRPAKRNPFSPGSPGTKRIRCPTCGGTGQVQSQQSSTSNQPSSNQAASRNSEAERQRALAEQRKKEQEEAKRFNDAKQEALRCLKGIAENELGLKCIDMNNTLGLKGIGEMGTGDLGLKGIEDSTSPAPVDSSLVDLRHLDPNRPIIVDPYVVRGKERVFAAQLDPETYKNTNYKEGYECLKRHDPYTAVKYFEQACKERPQDPVVRDGLYLAQHMIKTREQTNLEERCRAAREMAARATAQIAAYPQYAALPALWLREAHQLCPQDPEIRDASSIAYGMFLEQERSSSQSREQKEREERALRKADTCVPFIFKGNYAEAIRILKDAQAISPGQFNIENTLSYLEGVEVGRAEAQGQNNQRDREQKEREAQALRKADTCVPFIFKGNFAEAIRVLKEAQAISPGQRNIENTLSYLEGVELGRAKVNKQKEKEY
ncbi:MAG: hypothetical protein JW749_03325 [Sedimentisphaerales bacterium]|nr:hypothetical protein [Sedimentisphaerales bacterium]